MQRRLGLLSRWSCPPSQQQRHRSFSMQAGAGNGALRRTAALLAPGKKRSAKASGSRTTSPRPSAKKAVKAARTRGGKSPPPPAAAPLQASQAPSSMTAVEAMDSFAAVDFIVDVDQLGSAPGRQGTSATRPPAPDDDGEHKESELKPPAVEFTLDAAAAAEARRGTDTTAQQSLQRHARPMHATLGALLARANEALCGADGSDAAAPPRILPAARQQRRSRRAATDGGAEETEGEAAPVAFFTTAHARGAANADAAAAPPATATTTTTTQEALASFAEIFAATLGRWSPHTPAEQILIAVAAATAVNPSSSSSSSSGSGAHTMATTAPFTALSGRFHDTVREVTRCGPLAMLANTFLAQCASCLPQDADEAAIDAFVQTLMDAIAATATGTGDNTLHLRHPLGQRTQSTATSSTTAAAAAAAVASTKQRKQPAYTTLTCVLQRVVMELYLVSTLLAPSPTACQNISKETQERLPTIAHAMLRRITDGAAYTFYVKQRRGGPTQGRPAMSVKPTTLHGLAALLQYSFQKQSNNSSSSSNSSGIGAAHVNRDERRRRDAINAVCTLYCSCLPAAVHACRRQPLNATAVAETESAASRGGGGPAAVLDSLLAAWRVGERQLRLDGALAALPWLRLVPHLLTAASLLAEARMELAVLGAVAGPASIRGGCTREDEEDLGNAYSRLCALLRELLAYDRAAFEEQQQRSAAGFVVGSSGEATQAKEERAAAGGGLPGGSSVVDYAEADAPSADPSSMRAANGSEEDGGEAAPLERRRGKRSLFYQDAKGSEDSVLLREDEDGIGGGVGRKSASSSSSRFVSRGSGGVAGAGRGVASPPPSSSPRKGEPLPRGLDGGGSGADTFAASALLDVMVNSRETGPLLVERYALDRVHRETTVEDSWLALVHSLGQLQRLLHSPPAVAPLHGRTKSGHGGEGDGTAVADGGEDKGAGRQQSPPLTLSPSHLPEGLRALLEANPARTRQEQEQRLADALRVLVASQAALPTSLFDGVLRVIGRLSDVLVRVSNVAVQQLQNGALAFPRGGGSPARALGTSAATPSHADFIRHQRRLNLLLVVGARELVWHDTSAWDAVWRTWHLRVAPLPRSPAAASLRSFPPWSAAANKLLSRLAEEQFLVAQRRRDGKYGKLVAVAKEALRTLREGGDGGLANAERMPGSSQPPPAPLSVLGRQSAAALVLSCLHSCVDYSVRWGERAGRVVAPVSPTTHEEVASVFDALLAVLEGDPELTLLCGYPVFLQTLYETFAHLTRHHTGGSAIKARMHAFVSSHLFPILMPAIVESLEASRGDVAASASATTTTRRRKADGQEAKGKARASGGGGGGGTVTGTGHATQCELTLLVLSELSRLCTMRRPTEAASASPSPSSSSWNDCVMQLAVYCLRQARRSGFRKARDFDLPAPTLPRVPAWSPEARSRCAWILHGAPAHGDVTTAGGSTSGGSATTNTTSASDFIPFLNWCNELIISGYVKAELRAHSRTAIAALEDYQRTLARDVVFSPLSQYEAAAAAAATTNDAGTPPSLDRDAHALAALPPSGLIQQLGTRHRAMQAWHEAVSAARHEAIRGCPFFANQPGGGSTAARRLHYLVQFMDIHLQKEERRARNAAVLATTAPTEAPASAAASGNGGGASTGLATASVRAGDALSYGLSTLDDSPLIVLDFLGYLTSDGGWAMVSRALCLCDTAFRVERRRHRHALAEVRETAVTAVLSQLRVVPAPQQPAILKAREPTGTALLPSYLSLSLLQSACSLSDAVSKDGSLTLLGCGRRDPVTAMLSSPSAEEYRSMLFGVKQVTVYMEAEAQRYKAPAAAANAEEPVDTEEEEVDADPFASTAPDASVPAEDPLEQNYFRFIAAHARSQDPVAVSRCERYRGDFRVFVTALVAAIDLNLEVVRHHALQVGVMDADMRALLAVSYSTLVKAFTQTATALRHHLASPTKASEGEAQDEGTALLFMDECALVSLAGLCLSAFVSHIAQLDFAGVFTTTPIRKLSSELVEVTQSLLDATTAAVAHHGAAMPASRVPSSSGDEVVDGSNNVQSTLTGAEIASFPTAATLMRAVEQLSQDIRLSRRVLLRFGIAQHRERHDLSATLLTLYTPTSRVVAAAAAAASSTGAGGGDSAIVSSSLRLFYGVWDSVRRELAQDWPATSSPSPPRRGKVQRTSSFAPAAATLPVPSLAELKLVLGAFDDFDAAEVSRSTSGNDGRTPSPASMVWRYGDSDALEKLSKRVREVPSPLLAPSGHGVSGMSARHSPRGSGAGEDEGEFLDFDETGNREWEEGVNAVASDGAHAPHEHQQREGAAGASPASWSAAFLTSFPDAAEVLAERDGASGLSDAELMDAVVQQGGVLRRVYKGREKGSSPLMGPQLQHMKQAFWRNVMTLLRVFPLSTIAERPNAADGLFAALDVFVNATAQDVAADPLFRAGGDGGDGGQGTDRNSGVLVDMEQRQALCQLLERKIVEELLKPVEKGFAEHQQQLLEAVRAERAVSAPVHPGNDAAPGPLGSTAKELFLLLPEKQGARSPALLTRSAERLTQRSLRQTSAMEEGQAFGLVWHDDIRHAVGAAGTEHNASCYHPPAHLPPSPRSQAPHQQPLPPPLPLAVTMALLRMLVHGEKNDPATRSLAEVAATYAMRQYVLLRPRLAGTAVNVLPLLYGETDGLSVELSPRDVQVLLDWRLPLKSAYADAIAGALFSPPQQEAFLSQYALAMSPTTTTTTTHANLADRAAGVSAEQLVFEYVRGGALYMHLLSVISALLHKFEVYGDLQQDEASSLRRRYLQLLRVARQEEHRRRMESRYLSPTSRGQGGEDGGADASPSTPSSPPPLMKQFVDREALLRELQSLMVQRQTTPQGVNANLLESAMLHFLNVSCVLLHHADTITHLAVDRTVAAQLAQDAQHRRQQQQQGHEKSAVAWPEAGSEADTASAALTAYASELRVMLVAAFQDSVTTVMHQSERASPLSLAQRVLNYILCSTPCDILTEQQLASPPGATSTELAAGSPSPSALAALLRWRRYRPEWFSCSPTMLAVVSPHYFIRCLANSMRLAQSETIAMIATCFTFYVRRSDMGLAALLSATTELLTATPVRNTALTVYCEQLVEGLIQREDFRQALAPPTIASRDQSAAGSVSNEILVPFLAAIARHDVHVSKNALATLLHTVMRGRAEVFGLPPIPDRQGKLSLVKADTKVGGAFDIANPLYADRERKQTQRAEVGEADRAAAAGNEDDGDGDGDGDALAAIVLDTYGADPGTAARTHRRGLGSLNLTLPAVMEIAGHMRAMRKPNYAETHRAKAMLRAAADSRRERVAVYRSQVHAATGAAGPTGGEGEMAAAAIAKLDASLTLEDPNDFGVAVLHLHYALRKVVHASFRRLAGNQSPRVVSDMLEMLLEADESYRHWWRLQQEYRPLLDGGGTAAARRGASWTGTAAAERGGSRGGGGGGLDAAEVRARRRAALGVADPVNGGGDGVPAAAATASAALALASTSPAPLRDTMLAGTLRLLVARALTCALGCGYDAGEPMLLLAASSSAPAAPLLLPPLNSTEEARRAKVATERSASAAVAASRAPMSHRSRQRILRALASVRRTNRLAAAHEAALLHRRSHPATRRRPMGQRVPEQVTSAVNSASEDGTKAAGAPTSSFA